MRILHNLFKVVVFYSKLENAKLFFLSINKKYQRKQNNNQKTTNTFKLNKEFD